MQHCDTVIEDTATIVHINATDLAGYNMDHQLLPTIPSFGVVADLSTSKFHFQN